jgi:hypothetical protein
VWSPRRTGGAQSTSRSRTDSRSPARAPRHSGPGVSRSSSAPQAAHVRTYVSPTSSDSTSATSPHSGHSSSIIASSLSFGAPTATNRAGSSPTARARFSVSAAGTAPRRLRRGRFRLPVRPRARHRGRRTVPRGSDAGDDILRAVNGAVSSVGVSAGLRFLGGNIPVVVDGTRVCALFFGTFVRV